MIRYLPHFKDNLGNTWGVIEMHWIIGWRGRTCEIECQLEDSSDYPKKTFYIAGVGGEFLQWQSDEVVDCIPDKGMFYHHIMTMFKDFDTTDKVDYEGEAE